MDKDKVLGLARLSRIEIREDEAENLSREFGAILDYVSEVKEASSGLSDNGETNKLKDTKIFNVLREDKDPHEAGLYTKEILEQAPSKVSGFIKVKKIL